MNKAFALGVLILFGGIAHAEKSVNCRVYNVTDAKKCMAKLAETRVEYEEPNDGLATRSVSKLVDALVMFNAGDKAIATAAAASFAGIMIEHGDEHHIYYFAISMGDSVSPVEVYDLNVVDIVYLERTNENLLNPDAYTLGIGKARSIDVYEDLKSQIRELKDGGN